MTNATPWDFRAGKPIRERLVVGSEPSKSSGSRIFYAEPDPQLNLIIHDLEPAQDRMRDKQWTYTAHRTYQGIGQIRTADRVAFC